MFQNAALTVGLAFAALVGFVAAVDETTNPGRIAQLIAANSHLDQQAILKDDSDWHFDFTENKNYNFAPGGVANMNAATFPAAKIGGMTSECSSAAHLLFCIYKNHASADHHRSCSQWQCSTWAPARCYHPTSTRTRSTTSWPSRATPPRTCTRRTAPGWSRRS